MKWTCVLLLMWLGSARVLADVAEPPVETTSSETTATPPEEVFPLIPATYVSVWMAGMPIRMVLDSPATPGVPISIFRFPVVRFFPASRPIAILKLPVVLS